MQKKRIKQANYIFLQGSGMILGLHHQRYHACVYQLYIQMAYYQHWGCNYVKDVFYNYLASWVRIVLTIFQIYKNARSIALKERFLGNIKKRKSQMVWIVLASKVHHAVFFQVVGGLIWNAKLHEWQVSDFRKRSRVKGIYLGNIVNTLLIAQHGS